MLITLYPLQVTPKCELSASQAQVNELKSLFIQQER